MTTEIEGVRVNAGMRNLNGVRTSMASKMKMTVEPDLGGGAVISLTGNPNLAVTLHVHLSDVQKLIDALRGP